MERKGGIWFAQGGTRKLVQELVALAKRSGIRFRFDARVTGVVTGLAGRLEALEYEERGDKRSLPCDVCVWGGDPIKAYGLLGPERLSLVERLRAKTAQSSMGLYVLYFKTTKRYPDVAHHTIILSRRWEGLLKEIFGGSNLPPDPSLYLHRPATTDPGFELPDGDLFYVLAPVPHLGNFSAWESQELEFKRTVLSVLGERVLPGILDTVDFAESVDPRYFGSALHSHLGAGFSIAPTLRQSAWFRFHNRSDKVPNFFLCGAGVHPGGGLPGVVTSAKVVERFVRPMAPVRGVVGEPAAARARAA